MSFHFQQRVGVCYLKLLCFILGFKLKKVANMNTDSHIWRVFTLKFFTWQFLSPSVWRSWENPFNWPCMKLGLPNCLLVLRRYWLKAICKALKHQFSQCIVMKLQHQNTFDARQKIKCCSSKSWTLKSEFVTFKREYQRIIWFVIKYIRTRRER